MAADVSNIETDETLTVMNLAYRARLIISEPFIIIGPNAFPLPVVWEFPEVTKVRYFAFEIVLSNSLHLFRTLFTWLWAVLDVVMGKVPSDRNVSNRSMYYRWDNFWFELKMAIRYLLTVYLEEKIFMPKRIRLEMRATVLEALLFESILTEKTPPSFLHRNIDLWNGSLENAWIELSSRSSTWYHSIGSLSPETNTRVRYYSQNGRAMLCTCCWGSILRNFTIIQIPDCQVNNANP